MKQAEREIIEIEATLRKIFNQDNVRAIDVTRANHLCDKWKMLTKYKTDNTNPFLDFVDVIDWEEHNELNPES